MAAKIIKDDNFVDVKKGVRVDGKRRLILPSSLAQDDVLFHVYANRFGQIVLDPQVTIPASEAWLFNNPEAMASVRQGLADAAAGKTSKVDLDTL
jgi:hypothetical protein